MAQYRYLIDALNAIDIAAGGTGGHAYMIDAVNEWAVQLGGNGGHKYTIDALNEIAGLEGATSGLKFDVLELNSIAGALGGVGGHTYYIDALNELADLDTGGGGGGAYVAKAVHFGIGDNFIHGGEATGTALLASFSMWVNVPDAANFAFFVNQSTTHSFDVSTGFNFEEFDIVIEAMGSGVLRGTQDNTLTLNQWLHLAGNMDLNHPQGSRLMNLYLNGVSVLDAEFDQDAYPDGEAFIDKTAKFVIPGYDHVTDDNLHVAGSEGVPFDVADYMIWMDQYIDWSNPLNMAKVLSGGKPVDPATAVSAFGTPQILLSGDASTFATNQGTGNAFATIGTLSNAATSPSD